MPKYRQLHTKVINSFDFNEMPDDFTRVVWLLLTLILDSEGRGIDNMSWVKSNMFPMRDDILSVRLEAPFRWMESRGMIVRYEVNGRKYFYVPTFKSYQSGTKKEAKSLLPAPPEELRSSSGVDQEEVGAAESASASESEFKDMEEEKIKRIYQSYEHEIGLITKTIADEINDLADILPVEYFEKAFAEAAKNNKRSWAYARAILKRFEKEGIVDRKKPKKPTKQKIVLPDGQVTEVMA